jgi:hypothetical protein
MTLRVKLLYLCDQSRGCVSEDKELRYVRVHNKNELAHLHVLGIFTVWRATSASNVGCSISEKWRHYCDVRNPSFQGREVRRIDSQEHVTFSTPSDLNIAPIVTELQGALYVLVMSR